MLELHVYELTYTHVKIEIIYGSLITCSKYGIETSYAANSLAYASPSELTTLRIKPCRSYTVVICHKSKRELRVRNIFDCLVHRISGI